MEQELRFSARDGVPLVGALFSASRPRGAVLLGAATAVPARFYQPFARFLAEERGLTSLTFDYRGIGRSLVGDIARCEATKVQWGAADLPAALDALAAACPDVPLHLVGNSAGGALCGLMDNVAELARIAQIGVSSGHLAHLAPRYRPGATFILKAYIPLASALFGYVPARKLGLGEDLPRGVAREWAAWCSRPGYVANGFGSSIAKHHYDAVTAPILNLAFTDDPIATEHNVEDILRLFTHAPIERRRLRPADFGLRAVGHVGFFRMSNAVLWPLVADFLDGQRA